MRAGFLAWVRNLPNVDENWKYGLVLMGFLTEYLLDKQMRRKGSKPFLKRLENLRMTWENVPKLLLALKLGLEEVDAFEKEMVKEIFAEIASALLQSSKPKVSVGELNFYIASGMGLYHKHKDLLHAELYDPSELPNLIANLWDDAPSFLDPSS